MLLVRLGLTRKLESGERMGIRGKPCCKTRGAIMVPRQEAEILRSVLDDPRKYEALCTKGPLVAWGALFTLLLVGGVFAL